MDTSAYTTFLFARPSFLSGMASVLDLGGTLVEYNQSIDGEQADRIALNMDMRAVGEDMRRAMAEFAEEHAERLAHASQAR